MSKKINTDGLQDAIRDILSEYETATYADIKRAVDKTAQQTAKNTKAGAPVRTGKYKKGWGYTKQDESAEKYSAVVHNKIRPSLAHLLQNGHGGPHPARAYPHIQPDDETEKLFEQNLIKELNS